MVLKFFNLIIKYLIIKLIEKSDSPYAFLSVALRSEIEIKNMTRFRDLQQLDSYF